MNRALVVLLASLASSSLGAATVDWVRVWPGYRTAESFEGAREYFTGRESTGGRIVLRSQPTERAGFYFLTRLKNSARVEGARLSVRVILPGDKTPRDYAFTADLPEGEPVIQVGLTGSDWPGDRRLHPLAWHVALLSPSGEKLAESQSFLWSLP